MVFPSQWKINYCWEMKVQFPVVIPSLSLELYPGGLVELVKLLIRGDCIKILPISSALENYDSETTMR